METTNFDVSYFGNVFLINRRYKWQVKKLEIFHGAESANFHACCFDFLSIVNETSFPALTLNMSHDWMNIFLVSRLSSVNKMTWLFSIKAKS